MLADWAAIAIANARLYRTVRERRDELERTIRGLETTTEISRALGGVTDLERVLELVVKRSRALIDARAAEIALLDGDEFVMAAVAGEGMDGFKGTRIPIGDSLAAHSLNTGRQHRLAEVPPNSFAYRELDARAAIVTPMSFRNRPVGFLIVFDRLGGDRPFNEEDERLLQAFAASAATAVATAQNAAEEALRRSIEASESERTRWARELHDETLQQLAGLRVLLAGARRSGEGERMSAAIDSALEQITTAIGDLRSLITELRPAALDELGAKPALETLVAGVMRADRHRDQPRDRSRLRERRRGVPPRTGDRVDGLPDRAGGAPQRRQARGGDPGRRARQRPWRRHLAAGPRQRPRVRRAATLQRLRAARDARASRARRRDVRARVQSGQWDRAAGDDPDHAPRITSTEHGAWCATRSLTLASADSPLRPELPTTTSPAPQPPARSRARRGRGRRSARRRAAPRGAWRW